MSEIDSLEIKISAEAQSANKALEGLITRLDTLSTKLGKVSGGGLNNLADGVSKLGISMQTMNNVKTTDFTRLAKNISKLGNIDANAVNSAAVSLSNVTKALGGIGAVSQSAEQVGQLSSSIAKLGYKSVGNAITNMPLLASGLKDLMATLSTAPMVSSNLIQMTNALANFASQGSRVGSSSRSIISGLNGFSTSAKKASKSSMSLASAFGKFYATWWLVIRGFNQIKKAIDISSDLTEVQNVVDVSFGDMAYKVEEFAQNSIQQFGMSELALKQYSSRFQSMGNAMGINNDSIKKANDYLSKMTNGYIEAGGSMADMSLNLTKLTADMASFYNVSQKNVAEDLEAIFTGSTRPLRTYGLDLTQATLSEWAMKNGLDANVQSMSQAEKTLLRYQYVLANTTDAQGDFARTAGTWANQTRILTQQIQQLGSVIGQTFINALKPALQAMNQFIAKVISFAQTVGNALGKIFGWKYEVSGGGLTEDIDGAASGSDDLADGLGNAANNAKKLKSYLLGIDELNVLEPQDDDSSSGSGSGSTGTGSASSSAVGNWVKDETPYESWIDSLYELGNYVRDALIGAMESIDWQSIYEKARGFGKGLADFLNGLFATDGDGKTLFGEVGRTIASALNTAIYAAFEFGDNFDFEQLGYNIADGINNFFATFDFATLAQTLNTWVDGLEEAVIKALKTLDYDTIWQGVEDFFLNLEFDTVAVIIGLMKIKKIGAIAIANAVKTYVKEKVLVGLGLKTFSLSNLKLSITGLSLGFAGTASFDVIGNWIVTGIEDVLEKLLPQSVQDFIGKFVAGFATVGVVSGGNPIAAVIGGLLANVPWDEIAVNLGELFKFDTTQFKKDLDKLAKNISDWFNKDVKPWFTAKKWKELANGIKTGIKTKWDETVGEWSKGISSWWKDDVSPWFTSRRWSEIYDSIKTELKKKWNEVLDYWRIKEKLSEVKTTYENFKAKVTEKWNSVLSYWRIKEKLSEVKTTYENFKAKVKNKWDETVSYWSKKGDLSKVKISVESLIDKIKSVWNSAVSWWNKNTYTLSVKTTVHESSSGRTHSGGGKGFATGGFPDKSSLFWAGENGVPEILGTIGGRTAVAGGAEITGIRDEIYALRQDQAQTQSMIVSLLQVIADKDTSLNIDGREIVSAIDNRRNRNGYPLRAY